MSGKHVQFISFFFSSLHFLFFVNAITLQLIES